MQEDFSFKPSSPIEYSAGGQICTSCELTFKAPSMKDRKHAAKLKQFVARAQTSFIGKISSEQLAGLKSEEGEKKEEESGNKGDGIKAVILGSEEDLETFYETFDTLAKRVGFVDENVKLLDNHLEQLELKEYETLCFDYIANFIE